MVTYRHMGTCTAKRCCTPVVSPLQKGTLCSGRGEKAGTCSEYLYLSIPPACGTLHTGLFVTMGGKTVMPIFHFVARQAFSPFRCAFLPPALELFFLKAEEIRTILYSLDFMIKESLVGIDLKYFSIPFFN